MKYLIPALLAAATLSACETTIPANDTVDPTVSLQLNDGGWKTVASTDSTADLDTGCPAGTSANPAAVTSYIQNTYGGVTSWTAASLDAAYFYGGATPPFEFWLTTSDQGGAALGRVSFNDDTITASVPEGSITITELDANETTYPHAQTLSSGNTYTYRRVEITGDQDDPRTALLLLFNSDSLGSNALVSFRGEDFSGNSDSALAWMLPRTLCQ